MFCKKRGGKEWGKGKRKEVRSNSDIFTDKVHTFVFLSMLVTPQSPCPDFTAAIWWQEEVGDLSWSCVYSVNTRFLLRSYDLWGAGIIAWVLTPLPQLGLTLLGLCSDTMHTSHTPCTLHLSFWGNNSEQGHYSNDLTGDVGKLASNYNRMWGWTVTMVDYRNQPGEGDGSDQGTSN